MGWGETGKERAEGGKERAGEWHGRRFRAGRCPLKFEVGMEVPISYPIFYNITHKYSGAAKFNVCRSPAVTDTSCHKLVKIKTNERDFGCCLCVSND